MEVVSTSNLVSSENKKITTASYFQTMAMKSSVMPHNLIRGQMHIYKYEASLSFMMAELSEVP